MYYLIKFSLPAFPLTMLVPCAKFQVVTVIFVLVSARCTLLFLFLFLMLSLYVSFRSLVKAGILELQNGGWDLMHRRHQLF